MDENINEAEQADEIKNPLETPGQSEESVSTAAVSEESKLKDKKPGWLTRFLAWLFDENTSFGRFNKSFLRLLVLIIVLFASGVLVAYFVLYQPVKHQLTVNTQALRDTAAQLDDTLGTLDEMDAALTDMTTAYDNLAEDFAYTTAQNELLRVYGLVVDAQMNIQDKNNVQAKKELAAARDVLDQVLPELTKANKEDAERLDSRLDLVISEFGNDVKAAESDLSVMVDWVKDFDTLLQGMIDN